MLLLAVLVSALAKRTILSTAVLFHLVALTFVLSIVLYSSTDVGVARGFDDEAETPAWHGVLRRTLRPGRR